MCSFAFPDLILLPKSLHGLYITFRFLFEVPVCALFFASTFLPNFKKIYQPLLFVTMLTIIFWNLGLVLWCWQLMSYAFPYEGTIMFSLFTLFVFRLNFKFGIPFSLIITVGFAVLLANYPIYAEKNNNNVAFVFIGLVVGF